MINNLKDTELVELYIEKYDMDSFFVGYLRNTNEHYFCLEKYSLHGEQSGLLIGTVADIFKVRVNSSYLEKVGKMISKGTRSNYQLESETDYRKYFLQLSLALEKMVMIYLSWEETQIGIIKELDEYGNLKLEVYTESGSSDGYSFLKIEDVKWIGVDTEDTKLAELLREMG